MTQANKISFESDEKKLRALVSDLSISKLLDEELLESMIEDLWILEAKKDDHIFKTGTEPDAMFVIVSGAMKIYNYLADGRDQIYYIYREDDFVGGHNILDNSPYIYNGQAIRDSQILVIGKDVFDKYLYDNANVLRKILAMSFQRIRWAEDLINRLSTNDASKKTASLLINLAEYVGVKSDKGTEVVLELNREELGNFSGLTRETITRKLGEFQDLGYIEMVGNKKILVKDLEALSMFLC